MPHVLHLFSFRLRLLQGQFSTGGEDHVATQRCQHHPLDRRLSDGRTAVHRSRISQIRRSQEIPSTAYRRRNNRRKTKQHRYTEVRIANVSTSSLRLFNANNWSYTLAIVSEKQTYESMNFYLQKKNSSNCELRRSDLSWLYRTARLKSI
jgi:hypothetical protein